MSSNCLGNLSHSTHNSICRQLKRNKAPKRAFILHANLLYSDQVEVCAERVNVYGIIGGFLSYQDSLTIFTTIDLRLIV